jgi:hypothetical protein
MIISDSHRLVFVHIPKCAGTTIRTGLKSIDGLDGRFDGYFNHPQGGRFLLNHLPLAELRSYFPACYDKVETYDSYAILRAARPRFASALFQHLRSFERLDPSCASPSLFRRKAREICLRLDQAAERRAYDLMFFLPQSAFVALDGRQVVRHLYRIEDLPRFAQDLKARHGLALDVDIRQNEAGLPPAPGLAACLRLAGAMLRRLVGAGRFARLRSGLRRAGGLAPDALYHQLFEDEWVARFVDAYYAEDQERYDALTGQA